MQIVIFHLIAIIARVDFDIDVRTSEAETVPEEVARRDHAAEAAVRAKECIVQVWLFRGAEPHQSAWWAYFVVLVEFSGRCVCFYSRYGARGARRASQRSDLSVDQIKDYTVFF